VITFKYLIKKVQLKDYIVKKSIRAKELEDYSNLPVYGVSNVNGICITGNNPGEKKEEYILIEEDDFAYNPYRINVGSIGLTPKGMKGLVSPAYVVFRTNEELLPELLWSFLKSKEGLDQIIKFARGTVRKALRFEDLCKIEMLIPPKIKQKRILKNLQFQNSKIEDLKSETIYQLKLLKNLKQQILQDAVQGKLVKQNPKDEPASVLLEKIKEKKKQFILDKKILKGKIQDPKSKVNIDFILPSNWIWTNLDEISLFITDGTHQTPTYTQSGRIFLSAQNIKPFKFIPEFHKFVSEESYLEYIKNKKPEFGDILIARVGAGIGQAAIIDQKINFAFYVSLALLKPLKDHIFNKYLLLIINSPFGNEYSKKNVSSKGGSAGNFNLGHIRSFPVPLPPLAEQFRIVQKVEEILMKFNELEESIKQGQSYTEQLMQSVLRDALKPKEEG